jgi:hypothetical protein
MAQDQQRFEVADDLAVVIVDIASLKEQDLNAQQMQPRHFERLTENIRGRGQIESLPYVAQAGGEGPMEIVSGHHRARAARAAGLTSIPVLLDTKPMRRSEITARQIAHNELHGSPDEDVLRQLVASIDNADDLLATGLDEDWLPTADRDDTMLDLPHAEFDWRTVTLMFLPAQLDDLTAALDSIDKHSELIGVAPFEQFVPFADAAYAYGRLRNVRNLATVIGLLTAIAAREAEQMQSDGVKPGSTWTRTAELIGGAMPPDAADVVRQAADKARKEHQLPDDEPWRALEVLAAEYLGQP